MSDRSSDNWDAYQYDGSRQSQSQGRRDVQAQNNRDLYNYDGGGSADPYAEFRNPGRSQRRDARDQFVDQQRYVDDSGRTVIINNYISARNVYLNQEGGGRNRNHGGYDPCQNPDYYDRQRTSYYPDRQQNWRGYDDQYRAEIWARQEAQRRMMEAQQYGYNRPYDYYQPNQYYQNYRNPNNYYNQGWNQGDVDYSRMRGSRGQIEFEDYSSRNNRGGGRYGQIYVPDCYGNGGYNNGGYDDYYGRQNGFNQFLNIAGAVTQIAKPWMVWDVARHGR